MLRVKNITKKFKEHIVLDNLNLELEKDDMLGFLGQNGAGKSTTFRIILGLLNPTSGTILFKGIEFTKKDFDNIGFLPEERGLHSNLTVMEELIFMGSLKGLNKKTIIKNANYWLEKFSVIQYTHKKIVELSKGNQQKIQLIVSIIHNPELLILDEPFSGLDPINVEILKEAIIELNEQGTTIIFSSHRLEHIEELCNKVAILNDGRLKAYGTITEVKNKLQYKSIVIASDIDMSYLKDIEGVQEVIQQKNVLTLKVKDEDTCHKIFQEVKKQKFITRFEIQEPSIKDVFLEIMNKKGSDTDE